MPAFTIVPARTAEDFVTVKRLFETYTQSLGIDLSYQDIMTELSSLPGKYAEPTGTLLIARNGDNTPTGCVGLRPLIGSDICEMKRLYVDPVGRATGVGRALAEAVIREARALGYQAMRLDTLPTMQAALALYTSLGFERIEAYNNSPIAGVVYLEKHL